MNIFSFSMIDGNLAIVCSTDKETEMHQRTLHFLSKLGYNFFVHPRSYEYTAPGLTMFLTRDNEVPNHLKDKNHKSDVGICSGHVFEEYGDGVTIFTENPYGILIKDKAVADGYRKQFDILWKKAK